MKKSYVLLSLALLFAMVSKAQNGLEGVIVEKYYVSNANDTNANIDNGKLDIGSVTYRVYADMLPGFKLQAVFGTSAPLHEFKIATTTLFFNNEDRGAVTPTFTKAQAAGGSVMLDSWLSVGAASAGNNYGVLKTEDNGVATIVNNYSPQILQNADPMAGIPLTVQDGFILGATAPQAVTFVGLSSGTPNELDVFDNATIGGLFTTTNGSLASLAGSSGPDLAINKVLIGQFTTTGTFTFELNIQIGTPTGMTQQYVASNPTGTEILLPSLTYSSISDVSTVNIDNPIFSLYPNPSAESFKIRLNKEGVSQNNTIRIFDLVGHLVYEKKLGKTIANQVETVDIAQLASGQYVFQLDLNGNKSAKKIIKK